MLIELYEVVVQVGDGCVLTLFEPFLLLRFSFGNGGTIRCELGCHLLHKQQVLCTNNNNLSHNCYGCCRVFSDSAAHLSSSRPVRHFSSSRGLGKASIESFCKHPLPFRSSNRTTDLIFDNLDDEQSWNIRTRYPGLGSLAKPYRYGHEHTCQQVPRARHLWTMRFLPIPTTSNPGIAGLCIHAFGAMARSPLVHRCLARGTCGQ